MKKLILKLTPNKLFLIDAIGALLTAATHGIIFIIFIEYIGLGAEKLYFLSALACLFFLFSSVNSAKLFSSWRRNLKIISSGNLIFCLITLSMVFLYFEQMTLFAKIYFLWEAILVLVLAFFELKYAKTKETLN